ncbi:sulfite exporter TauE/SafE family protein [Telmatospirillum siberiense]|uniref:Probable membrane transporter protein n=1 Tax=Telmatospirillum siberiense TaxID=382514 RepID=A0A2N3PSA6_9PROT|nr:sulfite exporter TauE/SafE family protein [Telmatospirillum siberiense]PKU23287.1 hypothetical protein CWS72_17695 [Telmatospirillum siberiense]
MIDDPFFYIAAIPAVILLGLSKGGFTGVGMLAMPLIALVISPIRGAAIILPILIVQDAVGVWVYRKAWDRRNMAILLPGAFAGALLGYLFAARVSDEAIALAVGVISVLFGLRRLFLERGGRPLEPSRPGIAAGVLWGGMSGFTSMIANAGAPPFQVYVIPQKLPKEMFVGTGILFFAALNWFKLPLFIALGQLTGDSLKTSFVLFPLAIASTWAGVLLVRKVPAERFFTLIYLLMIVVGAKLLWDGGRGLF